MRGTGCGGGADLRAAGARLCNSFSEGLFPQGRRSAVRNLRREGLVGILVGISGLGHKREKGKWNWRAGRLQL
jgi:hypothetical protein